MLEPEAPKSTQKKGSGVASNGGIGMIESPTKLVRANSAPQKRLDTNMANSAPRFRYFLLSYYFPQNKIIYFLSFSVLGFTSHKMLRTSSRKAIPFKILISTTKTIHWKKKF
jgi:hypothetical protein